jgi:hypothetical protein
MRDGPRRDGGAVQRAHCPTSDVSDRNGAEPSDTLHDCLRVRGQWLFCVGKAHAHQQSRLVNTVVGVAEDADVPGSIIMVRSKSIGYPYPSALNTRDSAFITQTIRIIFSGLELYRSSDQDILSGLRTTYDCSQQVLSYMVSHNLFAAVAVGLGIAGHYSSAVRGELGSSQG